MENKVRRKRTSDKAKNEDISSGPLKMPKKDINLEKLPKAKLVEKCDKLQKELMELKEKSDHQISSLKEQILELKIKIKPKQNVSSTHTQTYPQNDIDFNCGVCVDQYTNEDDLWVHMDNEHDVPKHNQKGNFKCGHCDFIFGKSSDLKYHMKDKHITMVQPCKYFVKGTCYFSEVSCWYSHQSDANIEKTTMNQFICKYCYESFGVKHEMMQHRKHKHDNNVANCREYEKGSCKYENYCWFKHNKNNNITDKDMSEKEENLKLIKFLEERIVTMENQISVT